MNILYIIIGLHLDQLKKKPIKRTLLLLTIKLNIYISICTFLMNDLNGLPWRLPMIKGAICMEQTTTALM